MQKKSLGMMRKLLVSLVGMVASASVLVTAGFAWYTLSTNPEISQMQVTLGASEDIWISKDGTNFYKHVDISDTMSENMNVLRPVSTIDGLTWYVCDYNPATGNIVEDQFFRKQWCIDENHRQEGHTHCDNGGFYAYTDIWLKSTKNGAQIRLSIADTNENYNAEKISGSFVMSYAYDGSTVTLIENGPETCVRIGMMIMSPTDEQNAIVLGPTEDAKVEKPEHTFFIYEPNADVRSLLDKQDDRYLTDIYIANLNIKEHTDIDYDLSNGQYLQTYPIQQGENVVESTEFVDSRGILEAASSAVFPTERLIVQRAMKWDKKKIEEEGLLAQSSFQLTDLLQNKYILRDDKVSGRFVALNSLYSGEKDKYQPVDMEGLQALPASQPLCTLDDGKICQIRLFFWIEGQDLDCWNDVAGINFLARLEFATS